MWRSLDSQDLCRDKKEKKINGIEFRKNLRKEIEILRLDNSSEEFCAKGNGIKGVVADMGHL